MKRRELLFELALVFGGSQALGLLRILTPDEEERLAGVLRNTWRMDEATVRTFEKLSLHAREADNLAGSASLLPAANGQRAAIARLLAQDSMPPILRDRLLDTYAQLSELAGVLTYDLLDLASQNRPGPVITAAERFLAEVDPKYKRRHGLVLARYSSALALAKEIPEAAAKLTEAANIASSTAQPDWPMRSARPEPGCNRGRAPPTSANWTRPCDSAA